MCAQPNDGLRWTNRPTKAIGHPRFEIVRAPKKGALIGVCLSGEVTGIMTHWTGAKTQPCRNVQCRQCELQVELRWKGYVWFRVEKAEVISILEITPLAGEQFGLYFDKWRTLRGSIWCLKRLNGKANGPVNARCKAPEGDASTLPGMPSLSKVLKKIWNLEDQTEMVEGPVIRDEIARALEATNGFHLK